MVQRLGFIAFTDTAGVRLPVGEHLFLFFQNVCSAFSMRFGSSHCHSMLFLCDKVLISAKSKPVLSYFILAKINCIEAGIFSFVLGIIHQIPVKMYGLHSHHTR